MLNNTKNGKTINNDGNTKVPPRWYLLIPIIVLCAIARFKIESIWAGDDLLDEAEVITTVYAICFSDIKNVSNSFMGITLRNLN